MFSVIIPLYNKSKFVLRSIQSVLSQSFINFEIIVVDDGSTDDGVNKIRSILQDPRLKIISKENGGVSSARNRGIIEARYNYVCFLDADDVWHPDFLYHIAHSIKVKPELKIIGVQFKEVRSDYFFDGQELKNKNYEVKLIENYFRYAAKFPVFNSSAIVIRVDVFEQVGYFDESLSHGEDLDMWFRIMMAVEEAFVVPLCLSFYYIGDVNQATGRVPSLEKHLVGSMFTKYKQEYVNNKIPYFQNFVNEYLLINLRPFYMRSSEKNKVKAIIEDLVIAGGKVNLFYSVPWYIVRWIYIIKKQLS